MPGWAVVLLWGFLIPILLSFTGRFLRNNPEYAPDWLDSSNESCQVNRLGQSVCTGDN